MYMVQPEMVNAILRHVGLSVREATHQDIVQAQRAGLLWHRWVLEDAQGGDPVTFKSLQSLLRKVYEDYSTLQRAPLTEAQQYALERVLDTFEDPEEENDEQSIT
jgi:hypothetical protein